jgi:triphosphatase
VRSTLEHILPNAAALAAGSAGPEHLHQARIGLRRLLTVLRTFGDTSAAVEPHWLDAARAVFAALSASRDADALAGWLWPALRDAGAPALSAAPAPVDADPGAVFRAAATTQLLLELSAFAHGAAPAGPGPAAEGVKALLRPTLTRLHRSSREAGAAFTGLDQEARHRVRKRLKRLRYGAESLSSLFPASAWQAYAKRLHDAQEALGRVQDLAVAEAMLRQRAPAEPGAWFALGWIAGRRDTFAIDAGRALRALGKLPKFLR